MSTRGITASQQHPHLCQFGLHRPPGPIAFSGILFKRLQCRNCLVVLPAFAAQLGKIDVSLNDLLTPGESVA